MCGSGLITEISQRKKKSKKKDTPERESSGTLFHSNSAFCWERDLLRMRNRSDTCECCFHPDGEKQTPRTVVAATSTRSYADAGRFTRFVPALHVSLELFSIHPYHRRRCCRNVAVTGLGSVRSKESRRKTRHSRTIRPRKSKPAKTILYVRNNSQTIFTLHRVCVRSCDYSLLPHAHPRREPPVAAAS